MSEKFDAHRAWLGVESSERPVNAYHLLNLELFENEGPTIHQAVQRALLRVRPHVSGPHAEEAQSLAQEIGSAKQLLLNPAQKAPYDAMLRKRVEAQARKIRRRVITVIGAASGVMVVGLAVGIFVSVFNAPSVPSPRTPIAQSSRRSESIATPANGDGVSSSIPAMKPASNADVLRETQRKTEPPTTPSNELAPVIVHRVAQSIAQLEIDGKGYQHSGRGFLAAPNGTVVTAFHLVENASSITAIFPDGSRYPARGFVAADPTRNLVAIRLFGNPKAKPLKLGVAGPRIGDNVFGINTSRDILGHADRITIGRFLTGIEVMDLVKRPNGASLYKEYHLIPTSFWIQFIEAGEIPDCGGTPLINRSEEVVAIDAFHPWQANSLQLAIPVEEIRALLKNSTPEPKPFAEMPVVNAPSLTSTGGLDAAVPPRHGEVPPPRDFRVTLPTGSIISHISTTLSASQIEQAFPKEVPKLTFTHANGEIAGVFTFKEGELDGAAASFHPNGKCWVFSRYEDAKREGPFYAWDDLGNRIIWAEYRYNKKNGIVCLFKSNAPWFIQEYDKGRLKCSYLVSYDSAGNAMLGTVVDVEAEKGVNERLTNAVQVLTSLEAEMEKGEQSIKRNLSKWYREERKRLNREFRKETAGKRQEQRLREDTASAQAAQNAVDAFVRRATGK